MAETDFVLLESIDHYTFVVPRTVACASGVLKSMLDEEGELHPLIFPTHIYIYIRNIVNQESQRRSQKLRTKSARSDNGALTR